MPSPVSSAGWPHPCTSLPPRWPRPGCCFLVQRPWGTPGRRTSQNPGRGDAPLQGTPSRLALVIHRPPEEGTESSAGDRIPKSWHMRLRSLASFSQAWWGFHSLHSLEGAETPMDSKCLPRTLFEKAPVTLWAKQKTPGDQQVCHGGQVPGGWTPVLFTHRLVPWKWGELVILSWLWSSYWRDRRRTTWSQRPWGWSWAWGPGGLIRSLVLRLHHYQPLRDSTW